MSFPFHLPKEAGNTRRFDPTGTGANVYQIYTIPEGAVALHMIAISAGGGGGLGFSGAAASARGGGGGGGAGAQCRSIVPTALLPKTLYIYAGLGSAGSGAVSGVAVQPVYVAQHLIIGAQGGVIGGAGTGTAAGGAGAAGTASGAIYGSLGATVTASGVAGGAAGAVAGAVGISVSWGLSGTYLSGGAGGGSTTSADFAGGGASAARALCPPFRAGLPGQMRVVRDMSFGPRFHSAADREAGHRTQVLAVLVATAHAGAAAAAAVPG